MTTIVPVILAGGGGSRLWPISTPTAPKQLLALVSDRTMLQETALRFADQGADYTAPIVVTGNALAAETGKQLGKSGISAAAVIAEPFGRNTAAAVAVAAAFIANRNPGALMLVAPADHHISAPDALHAAVAAGAEAANEGALVTFGVVPARAETGYGYIERGEGEGPAYDARRFFEKPDADRAAEFVASGHHYWNAGIFLFAPQAVLDAMAEHAPDVADGARAALDAAVTEDEVVSLDATAFARAPSISIDYAVMEKAGNVVVVPMDAGWSDVGSISALHEIGAQDDMGNARRGFVIAEDCEGSYLRADTGVVAAIGIRDLAVVRSGDAVLVAPVGRAQDIRNIHDRVAGLPRPAERRVPTPVEFSENARALRAWLIDEAMPAWAEQGFDFARGGFHERWTLDGAPKLDDDQKRLRVQARQIFVCCTAHDLGLFGPYLDLAEEGFAFLRDKGWQETGGWPHLFTPDGAVKDPMRDAYDHAFVLFAMAALYRYTGDARALHWANRTMDYLDAVMTDYDHAGFIESAPAVLPRRANPHMHLLEAFLALFDATLDFRWLSRARDMVELFRNIFFDRGTGTLREFFDATLAPAPGTEGRIREAGHHWEWSFLLHEYERRSGEDCGDYIEALTRFALAHGHDQETGLAYDEILEDGTVHTSTHRIWPQTEALRGLEMLRQRGVDGLDERLDALAGAVRRYYLDPAPGKGAWVDTVAAGGAPLSDAVPASSLYHLVTGFLALGGEKT